MMIQPPEPVLFVYRLVLNALKHQQNAQIVIPLEHLLTMFVVVLGLLMIQVLHV